jgi:hypothetical protein
MKKSSSLKSTASSSLPVSATFPELSKWLPTNSQIRSKKCWQYKMSSNKRV